MTARSAFDTAVIHVDVATQTSPSRSTSPTSSLCPSSARMIFPTVTSLITLNQLPSMQNKDNRANDTDSSQEHLSHEEQHNTDRSSRRLPAFPTGPQYQTGVRTSHLNARTVSLPGTLRDDDLRLLLSQLVENSASENLQQSRAVSMPEAVRFKTGRPTPPAVPECCKSEGLSRQAIYGDHGLHLSEDLGCDTSSVPSTPRTIVIHSPSPPPSSCDSVEFTLEDPVSLPDSFLRTSVSPPLDAPTTANKAAILDDDGWITWSSSPPRPIPALHGPSSLPYARCPSGAEGTVIGEQSSMPRMIWGLDPNDAISTPHASHQHSRAVPIKPPSDTTYHNSLSISSSFTSTPVSLHNSSWALRFTPEHSQYRHIQEHQSVKTTSMIAPPELPYKATSDLTFRNMTREGTGLGLVVTEEQVSPGAHYERGFQHNVMDTSKLYQLWLQNNIESHIEEIPVEGTERNRQMTTQRLHDRHRAETRVGFRRHPSELIGLFSAQTKIPHPGNVNDVPTSKSVLNPPIYLSTPPNSSSPQWRPILSPPKSDHFLRNSLISTRVNPSTNVKMVSNISVSNDELSHELRRFVLENVSSSNSANPATSLRVPPIEHVSPNPDHSFFRANLPLVETPVHPPGLSIPQHMLLSQSAHSNANAASPQFSASSSPIMHTPSTLFNARSIPHSRLRQNQKGGAVKLATVPEEDPEATMYDTPLAPPAHSLSRLPLLTPSPLPDKLQPQSMEEKVSIEEELPKGGLLRVNLPNNNSSPARAVRQDLDLNQNTTSRGLPKKKRVQRRRKLTTWRVTESNSVFFESLSPEDRPEVKKIPACTYDRHEAQCDMQTRLNGQELC